MVPSRFIEPLEPRITPAVVIVNPTTATYTDLDGDLVTIKFPHPIMATATFFTIPGGSLGGVFLRSIIIGNTFVDPNGTSIKVTAKPQDVDGDGKKDGDGFANVGQILASTFDLLDVVIDGDLGEIEVGNNDLSTRALRTLTVQSLGAEGLATGASNLISIINGSLGKLTVRGDINGAYVRISGSLGSATVGGSIIGGAEDNSGQTAGTPTAGFSALATWDR